MMTMQTSKIGVGGWDRSSHDSSVEFGQVGAGSLVDIKLLS